jgi:hypothetical protein
MRILALVALVVSTPALADCKDEIKDIMDRSVLAGPFRTEATMKSDKRNGTMVSDVVPPNAIRTKTDLGGKTRELVKIGGQVWANEGEGWKELPPALAARIAQASDSARTLAPNLIGDAQCGGTQTVEGKSYTVYTYKMDAPGGKMSSSNTLFVDPASRLPARVVAETRVGTTKASTEIRYVYDPSIKLEPPELAAPPAAPPKSDATGQAD